MRLKWKTVCCVQCALLFKIKSLKKKSMNQHVHFYVMFINASCVLYTLFYEKGNISLHIDLWFGLRWSVLLLVSIRNDYKNHHNEQTFEYILLLHSQISNKHKRVGTWWIMINFNIISSTNTLHLMYNWNWLEESVCITI